ncbi:hypothetical protein NDU88_006535 [Pleurodeles waltl]|uniref:Uncharacterized protein n=1 Tax=Pleurodeles waltl TaxID=8319 RepID=A0AAV7TXD2_PLEWA|nr:hypothetical protein NDU88_006535 [Pleurodeles waltl]
MSAPSPLPKHLADNKEGQRTREPMKHQEPRRSMERQVGLLPTSYTLLLDTLPYLLDMACMPCPCYPPCDEGEPWRDYQHVRISAYHHDLTAILIRLPAELRPAPLLRTWSGGLTGHQGEVDTSATPTVKTCGGWPTPRQKRTRYSLFP